MRARCGSRRSSRSASRSGCCARCSGRTGGRGACASRTTRPPTVRCTSACSAATWSSDTTSTASCARVPTSIGRIPTPIRRWRSMRSSCSKQAWRALPTTCAGQVRQLVVMLLGSGSCTIERVAQHLGVDRRTIHRRLASDGQTFSGDRRHRPAGARRALLEGSRSFARRGVVAARLRGAERVFTLVSTAVQRQGVGRACARADSARWGVCS